MMDISLDGLLVIPVVIICFLVGFVVKNYTKIPNRFIPLISMIIGVVINVITTVADKEAAMNLMTFIAGAVSGLASTGSYELIKNSLHVQDTEKPTQVTDDIEVSDEEVKIDDNE